MTTASDTSATTYSTPNDNEIVITRTFNAPRQLVFDAHTKPEHLPNWMTGPGGWVMDICEIDLRPGGAWRLGWTKADGEHMVVTGTYVEVDRPRRLVDTECWGGDWAETLNTLELTEDGDGRTTLVMTMRYPTKDARDRALASGMQDGTRLSYDRMEAYLPTVE